MKNPFLNAGLAFVYIATVVGVIFNGSHLFGPEENVLIPIFMLSLFVLSAAVMGYLFLAQPAMLYLSGKQQEGITFFLKTVGTFALIAVAVLAVAFATNSTRTAPLPDGEHLGYIRWVGNDALGFDDAKWLSGTEGEDAAIAAGFCTEATRQECLPNDYFILNEVEGEARLRFNPKAVTILMQTLGAEEGGVGERKISLEGFRTLIGNPAAHWSRLPYTVHIKDGKIIRVVEVYVP